jgi:hypothetical protein
VAVAAAPGRGRAGAPVPYGYAGSRGRRSGRPLRLTRLAVAFVITVPVNRLMIGRGKGHAVVHQYHGH